MCLLPRRRSRGLQISALTFHDLFCHVAVILVNTKKMDQVPLAAYDLCPTLARKAQKRKAYEEVKAANSAVRPRSPIPSKHPGREKEADKTACTTVREVTRSARGAVGSNSSQNFDSSSPVLEQNSCWCFCISTRP